MSESLLGRIDAEALGGDVVKALRLCIMLGGRSERLELREWASRELRGYAPDDELPDYRRVGALLCVDGFTYGTMVTGLAISVLQLPEAVQGHLSEELEVRYPIPELQDMARAAQRKGEPIRLSPPLAADILLLMNGSDNYEASLERLYWQVASTTLNGVVERVRTDIIGLMSEMRSGMPSGHALPSADLATQAFNVVVKGTSNRVIVRNLRQASGDTPSDEAPAWRRVLRAAAWIAGIVSAIVGVVILGIQLLG